MADETTKTVTIEVKAADKASPAFAEVGKAMRVSFDQGVTAAKLRARQYRDLYHQTLKEISEDEKKAATAAAIPTGAINAAKLRLEEYRKLYHQTLEDLRKPPEPKKPEPDEEHGLHHTLESLQEKLGRSSTFTHVIHALGGAGPLLGIGLIARELGEATEKMVEFRNQVREGALDAGGIAVALGKSIPIFGGVVEVGQNIRELLTDDKFEIEEINKAAEAQLHFVEVMKEAEEQRHEAEVEHHREMRDLLQEQQRIGLKGAAVESKRLEQQGGNLKDNLKEDIEKARATAAPHLAKDIETLRNRLEQLKRQNTTWTLNLRPKFLGGQGVGFGSEELNEGPTKGAINEAQQQLDTLTQALRDRQQTAERDVREKNAQEQKNNAEEQKTAAEELGHDLGEIERSKGLEVEAIAHEHQTRMAELTAANRAEALRQAGEGYKAEVEQLRDALERQKEETAYQLKQTIDKIVHEGNEAIRKAEFELPEGTVRDEHINKIIEQANRQIAEARQNARNSDAAAGEKERLEEQRAARQEQLDLMQEQSNVRRQELADIDAAVAAGEKGLALDRAKLQIVEQTAQRQAELTRLLQSANLTPEARKKYENELGSLPALSAAELSAAQGENQKQLGLGMLGDLAAGGSLSAQRELQKAQLDEKFRGYREQLQSLAKSGTAEQQKQAQAALEQLPGIQEQEYARTVAGTIAPKMTADVVNNQGRLTGAGLAARVQAAALTHQDHGNEKQLKAISDLLKAGQTQQQDGLNKIATLLAQILGVPGQRIFQ